MPQAALQNAAALTTALDSSNGQLPQLGGCAADPTPEAQSPPPALPILTLPVLARLCDVAALPSHPTHPRELGEPSLRRQVMWTSLSAASRERESSETYQAPSRWPHGHMLSCQGHLVGLTQLRQAATHVPFPLRTCCRWRLGQGWSPDGVHDISIKGVTQCGSRTASGRAGVLASLASALPPGQPGSQGWKPLGVGGARRADLAGVRTHASSLAGKRGPERCRWHQDPEVCWLRLCLLPGTGPSDRGHGQASSTRLPSLGAAGQGGQEENVTSCHLPLSPQEPSPGFCPAGEAEYSGRPGPAALRTQDGEPPAWSLEPEDSRVKHVPLGPLGGPLWS